MNYLISNALPVKPSNALQNGSLALTLLGLMIWIELITPATVSPLISMLCFGIFAHRMRPVSVACWVIVFSLTTLFFLLYPNSKTIPIDHSNGYIRFWTVIVGGIGAVILSYDRTRIEESFRQTIHILEKLPTPVIISDDKGCIAFMNNDALNLLDTTAEETRGASYFSFVADTKKGRTVQSYFEFLDSNQTDPHNVVIQIKKPKPMLTIATLVAIEGHKTKLVATVFSKDQNIPLEEDVHSAATF